MPRKPGRKQYDVLTLLWTAALAITFFTTSVLQSWTKYSELIEKDPWHFALSAMLALLSFGLFILYAIATHHELNLLYDYLKEDEVPRIMPRVYLVIFGLALVFGILIAVSDRIIIYSSILVAYNLFDLWGSWQVTRTVDHLVRIRLIGSLGQEEREAVETIRHYYLDHPTLPRIVTIMFCNWITVCLSLAYYFTGLPPYRISAYIVVILTIVIGEVVIHWWRATSIYKIG